MNDNTFERKGIWNDAARSGLVLGLVAIAYMVINSLTGKINASGVGAAVINVASLLLWAFKFYLCIRLMKYFMQKYAASHEGISNGDSFRFGTATAMLSALLYAGFSLAWTMFIQPNELKDAMDVAMAAYENMLTEAQMETIQELVPKLPTITFFTNLLWCWLFGTVLAAIFSRNIPSRNPFEDTDNQ